MGERGHDARCIADAPEQFAPKAVSQRRRALAAGHAPSEAVAVAVCSLCAEGRNVPLAEHVLTSARKHKTASTALYAAVMRVRPALGARAQRAKR